MADDTWVLYLREKATYLLSEQGTPAVNKAPVDDLASDCFETGLLADHQRTALAQPVASRQEALGLSIVIPPQHVGNQPLARDHSRVGANRTLVRRSMSLYMAIIRIASNHSVLVLEWSP